MSGKAGLACAACLAIGLIAGIVLALARPDALRRIQERLGFGDSRQRWFYSQNIAFHRRMDAQVSDGAVLFIGDSFIQGMSVTEVTKEAINYGIGGDTTDGLIARLSVYGSLSRARAVVFAVGDNDLRQGRPVAEVVANYRKIIAQLPKTVAVFFVSLTPCVAKPENTDINSGIESLNRSLKELCAEPGRHFVDLSPELSDAQNGLPVEFADDDGTHLNGRGYRVCIEKLRKALAALPN